MKGKIQTKFTLEVPLPIIHASGDVLCTVVQRIVNVQTTSTKVDNPI